MTHEERFVQAYPGKTMYDMMKFSIWPPFVLMICLISCQGKKDAQAAVETIYFVNSFKVPCEGMGRMSCLQVKETKEGEWQNFHGSIEGFEYRPGYLYEIKIREEKLPPEQVPADASAIKYILVSVITKEVDKVLRLNDIWALKHMNGFPMKDNTLKELKQMPYIEMSLVRKRILGHNGCAEFGGDLITADETAVAFSLEPWNYADCEHKGFVETFAQKLKAVKAYHLGKGTLTLTDGTNELLVFRKVD